MRSNSSTLTAGIAALASSHKKSVRVILVARRLFACFLACPCLPGLAGELPPLSHQIVGGDKEYIIQPGDFLIAIGARFGVPAKALAQQNAIPFDALIYPGQRLRIHNPHIVPTGLDDGILINIPQRMLFHFRQGNLIGAYAVGLGKPDWPTPSGEFGIVTRETNKTWKVPKSIQEEMRREQKIVLEEVPPGPDNPLGTHWLGLSSWGYGLHGTIAPASVFHFQSHGCIRLHPDDVAELFGQVRTGTVVRIIYQPVLLAVVADGRIFAEIHRDIYSKGIDPAQTLRSLAEANGLIPDLNGSAANAVIAAQMGLAEEVGRVGRGGPQREP